MIQRMRVVKVLHIINCVAMSNLELVDKWCEMCLEFPDPRMFREITDRGLYDIVNFLPNNTPEAKVVARARMHGKGMYTGDPQIEEIASKIDRLMFLREKFNKIEVTDVHRTRPIIAEIGELTNKVAQYFEK